MLLLGPTAAGKSALAIELAALLPVDLVSVDSAMVYRGMDIGTGKPAASLRQRIPHALIDIRDPAEGYSVAEFCADAARAITRAHASGRVPLLVGGSLLYAKALRDGLAALPAADVALRARIAAVRASGGNAALHAWLAGVDPVAAARLHENDSQRLARALEVTLASGRPLHDFWQVPAGARQAPWTLHVLWLAPPARQALDAAISERFATMLAQGLEAEVAGLRARGDLADSLPSMKAVGYRQVARYLAGDYPRDEMVRRAIAATRSLAKRQYTWRRQFPEAVTLEPGAGAAERVLHYFRRLSIVQSV